MQKQLLTDLDQLEQWPEQVRTMQRNWIGRSEGVELDFDCNGESLTVYTTRPDTLMGATYMAVAPQHPVAQQAAAGNPELAAFIESIANVKVAEAEMATMEKLGMDTGLTATHPLTGEPVPIWVANFVLMSYGSGAVMSVPGHDERDHAFASKYRLPIVQVIDNPAAPTMPAYGRTGTRKKGRDTHHQLREFDGLDFEAAFDGIADKLAATGQRQAHRQLSPA